MAAVGVAGGVGVVLEQVDLAPDALFAQALPRRTARGSRGCAPPPCRGRRGRRPSRTRASRTRGGCRRRGTGGRRSRGTRCSTGPTTRPARKRYRATSSGLSRRWPRRVQVTPYSFSSPKILRSTRTPKGTGCEVQATGLAVRSLGGLAATTSGRCRWCGSPRCTARSRPGCCSPASPTRASTPACGARSTGPIASPSATWPGSRCTSPRTSSTTRPTCCSPTRSRTPTALPGAGDPVVVPASPGSRRWCWPRSWWPRSLRSPTTCGS